MATRISLLRSARQKEQREQIGDMVSPFAQSLIDTELRCLLRLSEAAREAGRPQVALNSVIRAQKLASQMGFEVSQEFANVLWITREPKIAVQYLRDLSHTAVAQDPNDVEGTLRKALLLTRLVGGVFLKSTSKYFIRVLGDLDFASLLGETGQYLGRVLRACCETCRRDHE